MGREAENTDVEDRTVADVERIRDIIFGSQIRQYEKRFDGIANQLDLLNQQLEELGTALDQQRDAQESRTHELQEDTRQRHTELHRTLSDRIGQVETTFGQKTTQMQDESRQSLDALSNEISARMEQQDKKLTARIGQLAADLRQQERDLRSEFTAALNILEDDKASRHDLGNLLMEVSMRLKGEGEIADLLEQLEETAQDQPQQ